VLSPFFRTALAARTSSDPCPGSKNKTLSRNLKRPI
jgi:hypothetical protein